MQYIIVTFKGQPRNQFGGRDPRKLGFIEADSRAAANKAAPKFGAGAVVMLPSEWRQATSADLNAKILAA